MHKCYNVNNFTATADYYNKRRFFVKMKKSSSSAARGLHIIIVGCGKVGVTLVEQLSKEGHDITIIDKSHKTIQALTNIYDVMGVVGNGASYSILNRVRRA